MTRRVLVVGNDEHAAFVSAAVARAGGEVTALDPSSIPRRAASLEDGRVFIDGVAVDVKSAYVKSLSFGAPLPTAAEIERREFSSWRDRFTAERERHSFVASLLKALTTAGVVVVNPVHTFEQHTQKAHQSAMLARAGVAVPSTLATCDPEAARAFVARQQARGHDVIYKPLAGGAEARLFVADDDARLAALAACPALFQERILGVEVRAYVLAGRGVGAFQVPSAGVVDARANLHRAQPTELARSTWDVACAAVAACGLVFAAVDLRVSDRAVVLEVNPAPAITFYDARPDGAVVTALARFLVDPSQATQ